jgi:hypothetical protein
MEIEAVWSLLDVTETSSLPEAVWHQSTDNGPGFFIYLLQRWDIATDQHDFKSVFYKVVPFLETNPDKKSNELRFPTFSLRLPTELAVVDAPPNCTSTCTGTGVQERRVPLLVRFSDNRRLLAMQFSSTMVRIGVPMLQEQGISTTNLAFTRCSHWTVDLSSANKNTYPPLHTKQSTNTTPKPFYRVLACFGST